jgi:subtilase family serine protease
MRKILVRRAGLVLAAALAVTFLPAATGAVAAGSHPAGSTLPSKAQQIKVLTAALALMRQNYPQLAHLEPGPVDVFDYNIGSLWRQGIDGAGTTIALIEGWDLPSIGQQVAAFDQELGLPDPQITTIFPSGTGQLPAACPAGMDALGTYGSCQAWGGELTLDVLAAHLIAPYAKIVLSVTPADSEINDDAASNVAPPEMMEALEKISAQHLANVISISDGQAEGTFSHGPEQITAQDPGELAAAAAGIPVLVGTGDCNVVQALPEFDAPCTKVTAGQATAAWDDSPWVTAMGGSVPDFSSAGQRLGADPLWNVGPFGEGAGFSSVFARPGYQNGVASITGSSMRSVPDLTMDSSDGTSEAGPLMAGVLALATQANHANVGPINPVLYRLLGPAGPAAGIVDVTSGNNSVTSGGTVLVPGFSAGRGFDVASGWGTIDAARFVPSLVSATRGSGLTDAARLTALAQLTALERDSIRLSAASIPHGGTASLTAGDFLPGHPVTLSIDGTLITTLQADAQGSVADTIDPALLNLTPGRHTISLGSMLLTETAEFRSS